MGRRYSAHSRDAAHCRMEARIPGTEERIMPTQIALNFRDELDSVQAALLRSFAGACGDTLARRGMDAQADRWTHARFSGQQPPALCARRDPRQLRRAGLRAGRMGYRARILRPIVDDSARLVEGGARDSCGRGGSHSRRTIRCQSAKSARMRQSRCALWSRTTSAISAGIWRSSRLRLPRRRKIA